MSLKNKVIEFFKKLWHKFFTKKKTHPLVKTAATRKEEPSNNILAYVLLTICLGLSGWSLSSTHTTSVNLNTEIAIRNEQITNLKEVIKEQKQDYQDRLNEYKYQADRRFTEIKKDLESINTKIDSLLNTKKTSQ